MKTKALLLGAAIATAVSACATTTSPTGRTQYVGAVSQEQLNQLGEQAFLQAKSKTPQSRDGRQNAYVGCVVDAIVRQLPPQWRQLRWEEALFADQETNAWALPGGKVGVNDGIFKAARNQDQLAGVIAHEIGHVVSRHHDERITRQALASGVLQVGGAVAGARYGEGVGSAVTQGGGIFAQAGFLLPNSRTQETESDEIGQRLMAQAGFDPGQAVDLWQNMVAASANRSPEWLSTHPDPQNRIRALEARTPSLQPVYEAARKAGHTPRCGS